MKYIKIIWFFFDGYKTYIGTIFLFIGAFIGQVLIKEWEVNVLWLPKLASTLDWIGMAIGGIGFTHKFVKKNQ